MCSGCWNIPGGVGISVGLSRYHLPNFGIAPEDTGFPILNTLGTQTDLIMSDIVYYETYRGRGGVLGWEY